MIYISVIHETWRVGGSYRFQKWLARRYVDEVRGAIEMEEYRGTWRSLSPEYVRYKQLHRLSPRMWEATGELKNRLTVKYGLVIGFSGYRPHAGTKKSCMSIARCLEYGTSKNPARPLFRKVLFRMNNNLEFYKRLYELEEMDDEL